MTDKTKAKRAVVERRPAGIRAMSAPPPRRLPSDHPAKSLFKEARELDETISSTVPIEHTTIPDSIPATIPTSIPNSPESTTLIARSGESVSVRTEETGSVEFSTPLDATHTSSERSVYSIMYRDTISKGVRDRHFGPSELMKKTGIRSRNTVHRALYGLLAKLSIEIVSHAKGNPLGPRYRIFKPKEIEQRRKTHSISIDPQTKKIVGAEGTPAAIPRGIPATTPGAITNNRDTGIPENEVVTIPKIGIHIKDTNTIGLESDHIAPSSSKSAGEDLDDDAKFLDDLRLFYERITGNKWTTADATTAQKGREIPFETWGIAICYCVDRAPGHRFERLAYVLEEARTHHEAMKSMPESDLRAILNHSARVIERARRENLWHQEQSATIDTDPPTS